MSQNGDNGALTCVLVMSDTVSRNSALTKIKKKQHNELNKSNEIMNGKIFGINSFFF